MTLATEHEHLTPGARVPSSRTAAAAAWSSSRPVVVGVDGSVSARQALHWAAQWAHQTDSQLTVVAAPEGPDESTAHASTRLVREVAEVGTRHPDLRIEPRLAAMSPSAVLIAASQEASLVVVATHGLGHRPGRGAGSVSGMLPASAGCPVVLVPAGTRPIAADLPVVLGFDGSRGATAAADFAIWAAMLWGVGLQVVQAERHDDPVSARLVRQRQIDDLVRAHGGHRLTVEHLHVGDPAAEVLACAEASMIVVGATGATGSSLLGPVPRHLIERAPYPLAVVPVRT